MKPVTSNTMDKTCDNPMSSNCVTYAGPPIPGINICKGASITEVLYQTANAFVGCCGGDFPTGHQSCYSGDWVDISSSIPTSGTTGGVNYTLTANVQYKWEKNGDLLMRGGIDLFYTPTVYTISSFDIPMTSIFVTCMPVGWVARQAIMVQANANTTDNQRIDIFTTSVVVLDYPTPTLSLNVNYVNILHVRVGVGISLDGVRFNLA